MQIDIDIIAEANEIVKLMQYYKSLSRMIRRKDKKAARRVANLRIAKYNKLVNFKAFNLL